MQQPEERHVGMQLQLAGVRPPLIELCPCTFNDETRSFVCENNCGSVYLIAGCACVCVCGEGPPQ